MPRIQECQEQTQNKARSAAINGNIVTTQEDNEDDDDEAERLALLQQINVHGGWSILASVFSYIQ